jgi:hypothetical protein
MKTKAAVIILSAIFTGLSVFAEGDKNTENATPVQQANLSGVILDMNSGEMLGGAEIEILGTDIKLYSDFDGNFTIPNLAPGSYNIIVSYISYEKSYIEELNIKAGEKRNLEVKLITAK